MNLMKLTRRRRRSLEGQDRRPWRRWILLTALLLVLSAPFLLDLNIPGLSCYRGRYRPPTAVTGPRLPDAAAVISINRHGIIRISSGEEMSLPVADQKELADAVSAIASAFPDRPFVLKIDREIRYEKVQLVLSTIDQAGVKKVYFHTELPDS